MSCDILSKDLKGEKSICSIANTVGLSYSNFRKQFREFKKTTPQKFRMNARINMAKILISEGKLTTAQIAQSLGFYDEFALMKQFKNYSNSTVRQYIKLK